MTIKKTTMTAMIMLAIFAALPETVYAKEAATKFLPLPARTRTPSVFMRTHYPASLKPFTTNARPTARTPYAPSKKHAEAPPKDPHKLLLYVYDDLQ